MSLNTFSKKLSAAFGAQAISMIVSVLTTLLLPKILGIESFGFWQLFIFYNTYTCLLHFGVNDGVYLLNGGLRRDNVDCKSINSQFFVTLVTQSIISLVISLFAFLLFEDHNRMYVFLCCAAYLVVNNACSYLGYVFQALGETNTYSASVVVDRVIFLIILSLLLFAGVDNFIPYAIGYIASKAASLVFCCQKSHFVLSAGLYDFKESVGLTANSAKIGISLTLAFLASSLVLGSFRFVVDAYWGIEQFSQFSLALSLINFFFMFVSQLGMVLFPELRRKSIECVRELLLKINLLIDLALPLFYALGTPICALLAFWLPQYADALRVFAVLLPMCAYNMKMDICFTTYFKVARMERLLLLINIFTLILSFIFAYIGVCLFESFDAIAFGMILSCALRCIFAELFAFDLSQINEWLPSLSFLLTVSVVYFLLQMNGCGVAASLFTLFASITALFIKRREIFALFENYDKI